MIFAVSCKVVVETDWRDKQQVVAHCVFIEDLQSCPL